MHIRHIPPLIIMIISGAIGIRLALSPVAVSGTTCTEAHPYYPSCEEYEWTATPVTVYPTASENDVPDTDPALQIPTETPTPTNTPPPTIQPTTIVNDIPQSTSNMQYESTPTPTLRIVPTPLRNAPMILPTPVIIESSRADFECRSQQHIIIRGTAEPHTMLLLNFDDRVVGGGITYASGTYAIPLQMGNEQRGMHRIEVIQRTTNKVIKRMSCTVP